MGRSSTFTYDATGAPSSVQVGSDLTTAPRYYYNYNGHGDVVALTDASGTTVATYSYDTFGAPTSWESVTSGWHNPYLYDGRDGARSDSETGLYWLAVRAYDPTLGRFLSRDPLGRAPLFFDASQPYVYGGNNPLTNVDPSGQRLMGVDGSPKPTPTAPAKHSGPTRVQTRHGSNNLWNGIRDKFEFFAGVGIALGGMAILVAAFVSIFASESWNPLLLGILRFAGRMIMQGGGVLAYAISQALQHILDSLVYVNPWVRVAIDALALLSDFAIMVVSFLVGADAILSRGRAALTFLQKMVYLLKSIRSMAEGGVIQRAVDTAAASAIGLFSTAANAIWDIRTLVQDVRAAMRS